MIQSGMIQSMAAEILSEKNRGEMVIPRRPPVTVSACYVFSYIHIQYRDKFIKLDFSNEIR